ncbi:MAG: signal peptidase I [Acidimicrobiia bacterium]|nr:signal peptidase I [Acidimicrobiia bacterium]
MLVFIVPAFLLAVGLKAFVVQAFSIPSTSMAPQLDVGDRVVVSRLAYRLHEPRRGDIVVFDSPLTEGDDSMAPVRLLRGVAESLGLAGAGDDTFIKRVIGLPGETVEGRDGRVFVDGQELQEPYLDRAVLTEDFGPEEVDDGRLWVMGDAREESVDSRTFGSVTIDDLEGRALVRAWPPTRTAFL